MQSFKPASLAAAFGLLLCLAASATQQSSSPASKPATPAKSSSSQGSSSSSETTVAVPPVPAGAPKAATDQEKGEKKSSNPISVSVNEVIVPVTVTDEKGRFVSDLEQKDFQVFEENKPQAIRFFTREHSQPVVIGFLLDMSTASRIHWKNFQDATIELIQNLLTGDPKHSGYLIDYAQDAEVAVNTTSDPEALVEKVRQLKLDQRRAD
jgi:hypothetical protein